MVEYQGYSYSFIGLLLRFDQVSFKNDVVNLLYFPSILISGFFFINFNDIPC